MRLSNALSTLVFLMLFGIPASAQLKDMPSQAEFDPILENADGKLKDLAAILTEFQTEASQIDPDRLQADLKGIQQTRDMMRVAHSGDDRSNKGISIQRLVPFYRCSMMTHWRLQSGRI